MKNNQVCRICKRPGHIAKYCRVKISSMDNNKGAHAKCILSVIGVIKWVIWQLTVGLICLGFSMVKETMTLIMSESNLKYSDVKMMKILSNKVMKVNLDKTACLDSCVSSDKCSLLNGITVRNNTSNVLK